jgi:putative cell wall-binding protein
MWTPPPGDYYSETVAGNFTGDAASDGAVYRASDGTWLATDGTSGATGTWHDGADGVRVDSAVSADLDGDGRDSIVTRSAAAVSELRPGAGSFSESTAGTLSASSGWLEPVVGDLTGAGREAVAYVGSSGAVEVATSTGVGNWGSLGSGAAFVFSGDFSGDGMDDIAGFSANGRVAVALSQGDRLGAAATWADIAPDGGWQYVLAGDFDGDAFDDIAAFHGPSQKWHFLRSTGSSFSLGASIGTPSTDSWSEAFEFDYNSDGIDEVIALDAYTGSWFLGRFDGVSPFFAELEDAPFRTTVVGPSTDASGGAFMSWFGQESNWIRTRLGYGIGGESDATQRVFGASKYSTSAAISRTAFSSADVVYVATGEKYPDALAGGAAAAIDGAPVLLTSRDGLDGAVADEIRRLGPRKIVILGGTAAISEGVGSQLAALAPEGAVRYGGADRYETASLVSQASFDPDVDTVYIATGLNFPDALAGVPGAGTAGAPILLVREHIPPVTAAELERLRPSRIVILGGPVAVSDAVKNDLAKYASGSVTRLAGHDRYATAAAVSADAFSGGADTVFVAIGTDFPDAVAAGAAAYRLGGPLLLVNPGASPGSTLNELRRLRVNRIVIVGSEAVIAPEVIEAMEGIGEGALTSRLAALPRP